MLLLPESESLGQNIRIKAIRGTSRVSLHPPERSSGDHPDGNAFVVSLFDIEILVTERLPRSRKEIEAESVGRNATNRRIRSAQIFGGYVINIRIFDDAAQGRFQALDFVRIRSYEEVQVGSRASQPVQASATDPNTAYSTRCSANARKIALSRCSSGIRGSFIIRRLGTRYTVQPVGARKGRGSGPRAGWWRRRESNPIPPISKNGGVARLSWLKRAGATNYRSTCCPPQSPGVPSSPPQSWRNSGGGGTVLPAP
jgi:hypothetical protein